MEQSSWRVLLGQVRPHRWALVGGGLLGFLGSAAGLIEPLIARVVIDGFSQQRSIAGPLLLLTAIVVGSAVLAAAGAYILERSAESVVRAMRQRLIGRLLFLRVPAVDQLKPGDLLSRLTSDTTLVRAFSAQGLVGLVNGALVFVGSIALMAYMDVVLLGVTLGVIVLIGGVALLAMPAIGRATRRAQEAVGEMGSVVERALGGFRTVKASGAESREAAAGQAAAETAWNRGVHVAALNSVVGISAGLAIQVSFLAVLGVGGARVASGAMSLSALIAFLLYLFYLTEPISQLVQGITQLQSALVAVRRVTEIEDLPTEDPSPPPSSPLIMQKSSGKTGESRRLLHDHRDLGAATVALDRVTFAYDGGPPVLDGVSFTAPAGRITAIVGPSGSGKSTVFGLLERFWDAAGGTITIDGRDIREWPLAELRAMIGYVEQDAPVLDGSIRDNLRYAAPDATDDEITAVLATTRLDGLVAASPEGLDGPVGHRGRALSGGERQRIAIARALLRRPRLLLLDEITSQLDAVNEHALREVVAATAGVSTVLVIAHRLSTITSADRIVVLDAGTVRAVGSHEELIAGDELYHRLATTQAV